MTWTGQTDFTIHFQYKVPEPPTMVFSRYNKGSAKPVKCCPSYLKNRDLVSYKGTVYQVEGEPLQGEDPLGGVMVTVTLNPVSRRDLPKLTVALSQSPHGFFSLKHL